MQSKAVLLHRSQDDVARAVWLYRASENLYIGNESSLLNSAPRAMRFVTVAVAVDGCGGGCALRKWHCPVAAKSTERVALPGG